MKLTHDKLAKLEARRAALDLRIRASIAEEKTRRRREDARGKLLLGMALLMFFRAEPVAARALSPRLLLLLAERDRPLVAALLATLGPIEGAAAFLGTRKAFD